MLKIYTTDMHIHTCLSPCGDLDMTPKNIVARAIEEELDIIAITDHNASENIEATMHAALGTPLVVFAGMEVASLEEAHLIALFDKIESMVDFQKLIYDHLIDYQVDQRTIDDQVIVNENNEVEGFNNHLLLGATSLPVQQLVEEVHRRSGIAIASHIDKESFSLIAQLGFIPDDLELDALEISNFMTLDDAKAKFPDANRFPLVKFSDAHFLQDIGKQRTKLLIAEPGIAEIKLALSNSNGRKIHE
jgi:PHP family Zn ribbon phosphoesterase